MARLSRKVLYSESEFFHILVQGIAKSYIFETDFLKNFYLKNISEKSKKYEVSILSFCIMGNHAHFLITAANSSNISLMFKEANIIYAQYFNKISKRVGYVFRGRFRSEVIADEGYAVNCIAYIHNNPVKAGLVSVAEEYEFCSARDYIEERGLIDFAKLKETFGAMPIGDVGDVSFIEDEFECKENVENVVKDVLKSHDIANQESFNDDDVLSAIAKEILSRAYISMRELALRLGVNREHLRRAVSKYPSP